MIHPKASANCTSLRGPIHQLDSVNSIIFGSLSESFRRHRISVFFSSPTRRARITHTIIVNGQICSIVLE